MVSISGYEYYLKANSGSVKPDLIFKQVLYEMHFPHSIAYGLSQINRYAQRLKSVSLDESFEKIEFAIGKASAILKYNSPGADTDAQILLLSSVEDSILNIIQSFNQYYFGITS